MFIWRRKSNYDLW